jgi:deoxyadenosine/deoxycytidine kinase
LLDHPSSAVQDRSVYEDAEVFARNLYKQGHLVGRDYESYRELYLVLSQFLPPPDLVVYLRAQVPTLLDRIAKRGRTYERRITAAYLADLNFLYEKWIENFSLCPVLTVPSDDLDYVTNSSHLDLVVSKIQEKLTGKDEVVFDLEEVNGA